MCSLRTGHSYHEVSERLFVIKIEETVNDKRKDHNSMDGAALDIEFAYLNTTSMLRSCSTFSEIMYWKSTCNLHNSFGKFSLG